MAQTLNELLEEFESIVAKITGKQLSLAVNSSEKAAISNLIIEKEALRKAILEFSCAGSTEEIGALKEFAVEVFGNSKKANRWLAQNLEVLEHMSPLAYIERHGMQGILTVKEMLVQLDEGIYP